MGNIIQTALADDFKEMVEEIGYTISWNNGTSASDYKCIVGDPTVSVDLETGGFLPEGAFQLKIARSAFGSGPVPQMNDRVTFDGDVYKINSVTNRPDSAYLSFTIEA